ncbi:BQ2448_3894 [Microbotryum intermedium]|uniref:BQ2448_3894 protein n=1 Tax=Microbotryum intermedium TaxID=269621 RepID=A0A238FGJ3_9BASI|nr:BQ2448_3894 [Microbotryum intermedium]
MGTKTSRGATTSAALSLSLTFPILFYLASPFAHCAVPYKWECIREWPTPHNKTDVQRFLGTVNWMQDHWKHRVQPCSRIDRQDQSGSNSRLEPRVSDLAEAKRFQARMSYMF